MKPKPAPKHEPMVVYLGSRTRNRAELTIRVTARVVTGEGRVSAPGLASRTTESEP